MNKLEQMRLQYDKLTENMEELKEELEAIPVTSFALNPRVAELSAKISKINRERLEISQRIVEYDVNAEDK